MWLAEFNVAEAKFPLEDPAMADFVNNLDNVNSIAENSEGFIWRLKEDSSSNTNPSNPYKNPKIITNLSVWQNIESLKHFMYQTFHRDIMKRRNEWFYKSAKSSYVLWWIDEDITPNIEEAKRRLDYLHAHGETSYAFTFSFVKT